MRKYSDSTDAYTDPQTGVLKNKLGLTTEKDLERAETAASALRSHELARNPIARNFDLPHLKAIHEKLFSDIYEWAGQLRTVDMSKGDTRFAHYGFIEKEAQKLIGQLNQEQDLRGLSADKFSQRVGHYMGELNVIHPFREGNGRSLREYMGQLANEAGYEIKWEGISREDMTQASIEAYQESSDRLAQLIRDNLVDLDRYHALQLVTEMLGKPDTDIIEAQQGEKYTGKILAVTDRYVVQANDKTPQIVLHERQALSGMQHGQENWAVEIAYPAGRAGIVRDLQVHQHGKGHKTEHEHEHEHGWDSGDRER